MLFVLFNFLLQILLEFSFGKKWNICSSKVTDAIITHLQIVFFSFIHELFFSFVYVISLTFFYCILHLASKLCFNFAAVFYVLLTLCVF